MSTTPVTVTLDQVFRGQVTASTLEDAFGPAALGVLIITDIGNGFETERQNILRSASKLAHLPSEELKRITSPETNYNVGWSHGVEKLKDGSPDAYKGSFYVTLRDFGDRATRPDLHKHELTAPSIWPNEELMPGFQTALESFCAGIGNVALKLAGLCDQYIDQHGSLTTNKGAMRPLAETLQRSLTHKARLLHYFPRPVAAHNPLETEDNWCASHVDDGCLTALTSALYLEESNGISSCGLVSSDPEAGLYIKSRTGDLVQISIPPNALAFQTGVALEHMSGRTLKAVPHFVRAPRARPQESRNTLAIFFQPNPEVVLDPDTGMTFGQFVSADYLDRPYDRS